MARILQNHDGRIYEATRFGKTPPTLQKAVFAIADGELFDLRVRYSLALYCLYVSELIGTKKNPIDFDYKQEEALCARLHRLELGKMKIPTRVESTQHLSYAIPDGTRRYTAFFNFFYHTLNKQSNDGKLTLYNLTYENVYGEEACRLKIYEKQRAFLYWANIPAIQMQQTSFLFGKPLHEYLRPALMKRYMPVEEITQELKKYSFQPREGIWRYPSQKSELRQIAETPQNVEQHYFEWLIFVLTPLVETMLFQIYHRILTVEGKEHTV